MNKAMWLLIPGLLACSAKSATASVTSNNLDKIMSNAIQGDTVGEWQPFVEFPSQKGVGYYIHILMFRERKPDRLRFVVYPADFRNKIVLDRAILYSISREPTRYEDDQSSVVQNAQTKVAWYGPVDYENSTGSEVIVDATLNLVKGSLEKVGITKSGLNEILKAARPENLIAPVEEPPRRQDVLSKGSEITKYKVFLQRIEYSGEGALDYASLKDSKLWEWYVKEGEKAMYGLALYVRLLKYGCKPACVLDFTPEKSTETPIVVPFTKVRDMLFK